jgi:hypothetical protein
MIYTYIYNDVYFFTDIISPHAVSGAGSNTRSAWDLPGYYYYYCYYYNHYHDHEHYYIIINMLVSRL